MTQANFDYALAFSRNIGWVTPDEQLILKQKRIAIAGLGGVGGSHLITLTRLGIGKFNISDYDHFGIENFNRQFGASMSQLDRSKIEVLEEMALDINPELSVQRFDQGINESNVDAFLEGVDLYVDSLDFFAVDARRLIFSKCAEKEIPAITAAPLGMSCAYLGFLPGRMTFEDYFRLEGFSETEQLLRFLVGLAPAKLHNPYLVYPEAVDIPNCKGPSTPMAIESCAGIAATEALKILLHRGKPLAAPWGLQFDAYRNKLTKTYRPMGNNHPLQQLALMVARKKFGTKMEISENKPSLLSPLEQILDIAKWAPSGDNHQPWRFELIDDNHFKIHIRDTRDWCVYDLDGFATHIATGALLETIQIAASAHNLRVDFSGIQMSDKNEICINTSLVPTEKITANPLYPFIKSRSTQRRSLSPRLLTQSQKSKLEEAVGDDYEIVWIEAPKDRIETAVMLFQSALIRLTTHEAYAVHKEVIEWGAQYSNDRIPEKAVGPDWITMQIMRWALKSWKRVKILNKYFAGTWLPRIQMDLIPSYFCGAHVCILAKTPQANFEDTIKSGGSVQRFWLAATSLGLKFQPEITPMIFSRYLQAGLPFTENEKANERAEKIHQLLQSRLSGKDLGRLVFMGRVGYGNSVTARSLRKNFKELVRSSSQNDDIKP